METRLLVTLILNIITAVTTNKESVLARQAVSEMKTKMRELAATTTNVIGHVSRDLEPGVLMALPKKQTLKRSLQRKRRDVQTASDSTSLPPPPTDATFTIPQVFQHMILHDAGSGSDRLIVMGSNELLDRLARAKLWLADGTFKVVSLPCLFFQMYSLCVNVASHCIILSIFMFYIY